jgi:hypothetical protein
MMLIASMPSALAAISYGGTSVVVPANSPAMAEGDSNLVVDGGNSLGFGGYTPGPKYIDIDPFEIGTVNKYAHAWVFTGAYNPYNLGGGSAEWKGVKEANSYDDVDGQQAAGDYILSAKVSGQAISSVTSDPAQGGTSYAESLIDAWAAETTTEPRTLWGNAQITSKVYHDGSGTATAGTTAMDTTGATKPSAKASYAAQRATDEGGSVGIPAKILGSVEGVTSLEANNFEKSTRGCAEGYSSISSGAFAVATDTGFQSYTQSNIITQTQAARTTGGPAPIEKSKVEGSAKGKSEARAWDPSGDRFAAKVPGTENAYSSVDGQTRSVSEAYKVGDSTSGWLGGPATARIYAAAGDRVDAVDPTTINTINGRDSVSYTLTDGWVTRPQTQDAPHYVYTENFIDNGNAESFGKDGVSGMKASTAITNVQQSSGAHAVHAVKPTDYIPEGALPLQGSIGGMVARATKTAATTTVDLGIAGDANPYLWHNSGFYTIGPDWTLERFDDAGTFLQADSQSATSTSSAGTYSISAGPVRIVEWIAGNDPLNNMYVTAPISLTFAKPVKPTTSIGEQEKHLNHPNNPANRNQEYYGWSGSVSDGQ